MIFGFRIRRPRRKPRPRRREVRRPLLESLEPRVLLSASVVDGVLEITGSDADDVIAIGADADTGEILLNGVPDVEDGTPFGGVNSIVVNAGNGFDSVSIADLTDTGSPDVTVNGEAGGDIVVVNEGGSLGNGTFNGGDGFDVLDLSLFTTPVEAAGVNGDGTASNTGGVTSIERVLGGSGGNLIQIGDVYDFSGSTESVHANFRARTLRVGTVASQLPAEVNNIFGSPQNDTLIGDEFNNFLNGLGGNDIIQGNGGNDTLIGDDGNDRIVAGAGFSQLDGGDGNDMLQSTTGIDQQFGGPGNDRHIVARSSGNFIDAGPGDDTIQGNNFFSQDTYQGGDGDDNINGGNGNNFLDGGAGNDTLRAGLGNDTLAGGPDDDLLIGARDNDFMDGGSGNDVIRAGGARRQSDSLIGGPGNDLLTAAGGSDFLDGGDGDDTVRSGGGNDVIAASFGNDILDGGGGRGDTLTFENLTGGEGVTIDLQRRTATNSNLDATIRSFETVIGSPFDDDITGSAGRDNIQGGAGNDRIDGRGGTDALRGDDGTDTLIGGAGNDILTDGGENDTLSGEQGNDRLTWTGTSDGLLDGGGGNDDIRITTGGDDEFLEIRAVDGRAHLSRIDANFFTIQIADAEDIEIDAANGQDTVRIFDLDALPQRRLKLTIDGGNNQDFLDASAVTTHGVTLDGSGSDDTLVGGGGNDVLMGGSGDDLFFGGGGRNRIEGGAGNNTVDYSNPANVDGVRGSIGLRGSIRNLTTKAIDQLRDIFTFIGSIGPDNVRGSRASETFVGGPGNDTLNGSSGDDVLFGDDGDDQLIGGPGFDQLIGGSGFDDLRDDRNDVFVDPGPEP